MEPFSFNITIPPSLWEKDRTLDREHRTYIRKKKTLIAKGMLGKFALIHYERLSTWNTYQEALSEGYRKYFPLPFMVRQINQVEPVLYV